MFTIAINVCFSFINNCEERVILFYVTLLHKSFENIIRVFIISHRKESKGYNCIHKTTVSLTPHFKTNNNTINKFIEARLIYNWLNICIQIYQNTKLIYKLRVYII